MKADLIDLFVEESGDEVYIRLKGTFGFTQLAPVREKIEMLLSGPGKIWFLDVDKARFTIQEYLPMFLDFLEKIKQKEGLFVLLFKGDSNKRFFNPYSHIFEIHPSRAAYRKTGFFKILKKVGATYSKQTGLRLSPGIAVFLLIILLGWFATLFAIIQNQATEIQERDASVMEMETQRHRLQSELEDLQAMVGPLRHLGLIVDSNSVSLNSKVNNWTNYLDMLERERRAK
ncbi:MAG: hypothetical protein WCR04_02235 [Fibrobacteraceae bacterium]